MARNGAGSQLNPVESTRTPLAESITFTRRHEQELAEIKALTYELHRQVQEGLKQLERIRETQEDRSPARPAVDGDGAEPLLAFVHIPKTAGATFLSMLVAAYSREAVQDAGNYLKNPERTGQRSPGVPNERRGCWPDTYRTAFSVSICRRTPGT